MLSAKWRLFFLGLNELMVPVLLMGFTHNSNSLLYDDFIKWKHFLRYWPFCAGNSPVTGEFPSQRPVTQSFGIFFIFAWTKGCAIHRDAGDLRFHRFHYDVTVMEKFCLPTLH